VRLGTKAMGYIYVFTRERKRKRNQTSGGRTAYSVIIFKLLQRIHSRLHVILII
jgi:hypothetical protein